MKLLQWRNRQICHGQDMTHILFYKPVIVQSFLFCYVSFSEKHMFILNLIEKKERNYKRGKGHSCDILGQGTISLMFPPILKHCALQSSVTMLQSVSLSSSTVYLQVRVLLYFAHQ